MKPQFIKTESGEELVVLSRSEYERLIAPDMDEDEADGQAIDQVLADIAVGRDVWLPAEVADPIMKGANAIKVVREWRGLTQAELARRNKLTQGYVSQLEAGTTGGSPKVLKAIAKTLKVPVDLLLPD